MIEYCPRNAIPQVPPTNAERFANWQAVYKYFANQQAEDDERNATPN